MVSKHNWLFYLVTIPAYFLIYYGLQGLGWIHGYYGMTNYPYKNGLVYQALVFVPSYQMAPFYLIAGSIMIIGVVSRYFRRK